MRRDKQPIDSYRKNPRQRRSAVTVEAILEASARILQSQGLQAFNTNAVAERAGISVGTLYQYFRNKDAILLTLARRELAKTPDKMLAAFTGASAGAEDPVLLGVRALLKAFGGRQRLRKVLIESLIARGFTDELTRPVERVAEAVAMQLRSGELGYVFDPSPVQMFVLTRSIIGIVRSAVMEQSSFLDSPALEHELTVLLKSYVQTFPIKAEHVGRQSKK